MVLPSPLEYIVLYQASKSLTLRLVVIVMAGGGPPSTSLLITAGKADHAGKDVDADLRRHDGGTGSRLAHRSLVTPMDIVF